MLGGEPRAGRSRPGGWGPGFWTFSAIVIESSALRKLERRFHYYSRCEHRNGHIERWGSIITDFRERRISAYIYGEQALTCRVGPCPQEVELGLHPHLTIQAQDATGGAGSQALKTSAPTFHPVSLSAHALLWLERREALRRQRGASVAGLFNKRGRWVDGEGSGNLPEASHTGGRESLVTGILVRRFHQMCRAPVHSARTGVSVFTEGRESAKTHKVSSFSPYRYRSRYREPCLAARHSSGSCRS